ncbi:MAG: aldehyde dehydrogenase [Alphaproteobacteria bacterium]|nr:aldehyde dehydrogenase [Alphaproteobacteria bacterium]
MDFDPASLPVQAGHFIGGRFVEDFGQQIAVSRPSDGRLQGYVRDAGADGVDAAVSAARAAYRTGGWGACPPRERGRIMRRFAELIEARTEELALLEATTSTRIITETRQYDSIAAADIIRYCAEFADKIDGEVTPTAGPALNVVLNEPYGVVAAIIPWNFPVINAVQKLGPILAAGNAVVLKPSELSPFSTLWLASLANEAGFPAGTINVVNGYGATTGAALVAHPGIRKVSFVGSGATGAIIMAQAARAGTKPVTLELGGKSPFVVFQDADETGRIAQTLAASFLYNSGQVCVAGSRLVVARSRKDELLDRLNLILDGLKPGPTWDASTTLGPVISPQHADRIEDLVRKTCSEGAILRRGGRRFDIGNGGTFFEPTVIDQVTPEMSGFGEEFFGPVLCVQTVDDEAEAMSLADHPVFGLAGSIFTRDIGRAMSAARSLEAGVVWINTHGRGTDLGAPAGGYKGSGFGKDWGRHAIVEYLQQKSVWIS